MSTFVVVSKMSPMSLHYGEKKQKRNIRNFRFFLSNVSATSTQFRRKSWRFEVFSGNRPQLFFRVWNGELRGLLRWPQGGFDLHGQGRVVLGVFSRALHVFLFFLGWKAGFLVVMAGNHGENVKTSRNRHFFGSFTLPKTNIAPENRPSQKETSIPTIHFQVLKC